MMSIQRNITFYIAALIALALPEQTLAAISWTVDPTDKSYEYLGQIFGNVGNVLTGTGGAIIGNLFQIFNIAVLALGSLVVSYTIIISTINTAQEGDVMGRKWSSMWIPLRAFAGMAFLIPTASGYSLIQILLMKIILMGVAAANQIWDTAYTGILPTTSGSSPNPSMNASQLRAVNQNLLSAMVCAEVFNNDATCSAAIGGQTVSVYTNDRGDGVDIGIQGNPEYAKLCGGAKANATPYGVSNSTWEGANIVAINNSINALSNAAAEIYSSPYPTDWSVTNPISTAGNSMRATLTSVPRDTGPSTAPTSPVTQGVGWLYAGSYYFDMVNTTATSSSGATTTTMTGSRMNYPAPSSIQGSGYTVDTSSVDTSGGTYRVGTQCSTQLSLYQTRAFEYLQSQESGTILSGGGSAGTFGGGAGTGGGATGGATGGGSDKLELSAPSGLNQYGLQFYNELSRPIQDLTGEILMYLTTNQGDPISSLRYVGSNIMVGCEALWFALLAISFVVMLAGCPMSGINPLCWAIGAILTFLIPITTLVISLLWAAGVAIGLYLPLIPYLVFTFTALGWFVLVIESMAAAPVVALGLVSPSGDHLGKASPAVLLIVGVFLRPSLMVIGFVAAIKLAGAVINMVNFGFNATVQASTVGIGIFGAIALIAIYAGLVIAIIHECFSLIYIIPDKILRWISGQAEHSAVKQQVQEVKQSVDKGGEMSGSMMKSTGTKLGGMALKKTGDGGPLGDVTKSAAKITDITI